MTKQASIVLAVLFVIIIGSVTALEFVGRDSENLVQFLGAIVVPTIAALWAGSKAEKAERSAARAEHNTNGRMRELIDRIPGGVDDDELYDDVLDSDDVDPDAKG